jgi:pimeloyl-ACP methyl ester carboxylesterase
MRFTLITILTLLLAVPYPAQSKTNEFPGDKQEWNGYDMFVDGKNKVVVPKKAAPGKPWVWRARFWGHEPAFDLAMLDKGYHVAYCDVAGLFGSPKAVKRWDEFYVTLTINFGLGPKPILEGMSRGGLIAYNWSIANPDKVSMIYGDAPVMDFKSWPGADHDSILKAYDFKNKEEAEAYTGNPIDNLAPLAKAGVPIIHIVGDADKVVPVAENTAVAEERYKKLGGTFEVIHKEDVGHHPHSLKDPAPLLDFVDQHVK